MELSNLEINKKIAELEGLPFPEFGNPDYHNWSLLGPLMVKYKVYIDHIHGACCMWHSVSGDIVMKTSSKFKSESEIPRAICLCILKSKDII